MSEDTIDNEHVVESQSVDSSATLMVNKILLYVMYILTVAIIGMVIYASYTKRDEIKEMMGNFNIPFIENTSQPAAGGEAPAEKEDSIFDIKNTIF